MNRSMHTLLILPMLVVLSGCATSRGVLDITQEETVNPESGEAVKIVRVSDNRQFQIDPPQPDIPSLKYDEINDPAITSRAIARKRNDFGMAIGDILLPENKTVARLVENSITRGFRESGYRVVSQNDSDFDEAIPIEVDIEKFWGWYNPGFWEIKFNFVSALRISGPVGSFVDGQEFGSQTQLGFQVGGSRKWLELIYTHLDALNEDITADLAKSKH